MYKKIQNKSSVLFDLMLFKKILFHGATLGGGQTKPSDRIVQNSNLKLSLKLSSTHDLDRKDDDNTAPTVSCKRYTVSSTTVVNHSSRIRSGDIIKE